MNREEQKRIVRQQRAGFAALRRLEVEEMRKRTPTERLEAFKAIMELAERMNWSDDHRDDTDLLNRWRKIRTRYATNRRSSY